MHCNCWLMYFVFKTHKCKILKYDPLWSEPKKEIIIRMNILPNQNVNNTLYVPAINLAPGRGKIDATITSDYQISPRLLYSNRSIAKQSRVVFQSISDGKIASGKYAHLFDYWSINRGSLHFWLGSSRLIESY